MEAKVEIVLNPNDKQFASPPEPEPDYKSRAQISISFVLFATTLVAAYLSFLRRWVGPERMLESFAPCFLFGVLGFFLAGHRELGAPLKPVPLRSRIQIAIGCGIVASVLIELYVAVRGG